MSILVCSRRKPQTDIIRDQSTTMNGNLFAEVFKPERDARVAVLFEQREITYAELRVLTVETAEKLNALELRAGDRVAILLNDSPEFIASFVAIISLGASAVPINMALQKSEQLIILKDCGARVAIVENQAARSLFAEPEAAATALEHVVVVCRDGENQTKISSNIQVRRFDRADRRPLGHAFPADTSPADAFVLYTSGSTGEPKGAVHSQSDIFYTNETFCREVLRLREGRSAVFIFAPAVCVRPRQRLHVSAAEWSHDDLGSRKTNAGSRLASLQRLSTDNLLWRAGRLSNAA